MACETHTWDPSTVYLLQGIFVLLVGLHVLNALLHDCVSRHSVHGMRAQQQSELTYNIWLLSLLWIMHAAVCFSSRNYYSDETIYKLRHYCYPLMFLLGNRAVWMSGFAFWCSVASAAPVLLLFFFFLLASTSVALLLMRGVYQTGSWYADGQYADFSSTFLTMFIYVESG